MPASASRLAIMRGFTLIELLIVVAVLSAASLLAFGAFSEDRSQIRHDDTRVRLQVLRRAILGNNGPSTAESTAGFVADNGAVPTDLATLIVRGSLAERAAHSPLFDPTPDDASCANNGGEITLDKVLAPAAQLIKGHGGDYLGGLSFNGQFRDGWGNIASSGDASNFGWVTVFNDTAKMLTITSLGADNAAGGNDFAADSGLTVAANDWLIPISGWSVTVKNIRTGTDAGNDIAAGKLSVSLLVFVNDGTGGKWKRHATTSLPCLDGNGDGVVGSNACSRTASVSFIDGCKPGVSDGQGRIPQGRHLLLLTDNGADGAPWTGNDDVVFGTSDLPAAVMTQVDFIAGRNLPALTLEIK